MMIKMVRVLLAIILLTPAVWGIWQVRSLNAQSPLSSPTPNPTSTAQPIPEVSPLPSAGGALKVSLPSPTVKPSQTPSNRPIIMKDDDGENEKEDKREDD